MAKWMPLRIPNRENYGEPFRMDSTGPSRLPRFSGLHFLGMACSG